MLRGCGGPVSGLRPLRSFHHLHTAVAAARARTAASQSPTRLGLDLDSLWKGAMPVSPIALQLPVWFWFCDWVIKALMQTCYQELQTEESSRH